MKSWNKKRHGHLKKSWNSVISSIEIDVHVCVHVCVHMWMHVSIDGDLA